MVSETLILVGTQWVNSLKWDGPVWMMGFGWCRGGRGLLAQCLEVVYSGLGSGLDEVMLYGKANEFRPVCGFGLAQEPTDVLFYGAGAEVEFTADLGIG